MGTRCLVQLWKCWRKMPFQRTQRCFAQFRNLSFSSNELIAAIITILVLSVFIKDTTPRYAHYKQRTNKITFTIQRANKLTYVATMMYGSYQSHATAMNGSYQFYATVVNGFYQFYATVIIFIRPTQLQRIDIISPTQQRLMVPINFTQTR